MHSNVFSQKFFAANYKIAIVSARFNEVVTEGLLNGAVKTLKEVGFSEKQFEIFKVPGSVEIPFVAQKCAKSKKFDAIVTLGAVIRGETPHFDYVCKMVSEGILRVTLDEKIPITFGVITCNNQKEAIARSSDDEHNKGRESVLAAIEVLELLKKF